MRKSLSFTAVFILFFFFYNQGFGRSWSDLDEGERKYYGSEKDEKYTVNAFFVEKEDWENHYSFSLFGLYKYTDYPKYTSRRVLPFYYGLSSKIDNRKMTVLPLALSYFETDGDEETSCILYPLYYSSVDKRESDRSILLLSWWGSERSSWKSYSYQTFIPFFFHSSEKFFKSEREESLFISPLLNRWTESKKGNETETVWWFPIIPLTYHSTDRYGGHRNILWLMDYRWETVNNEDYMKHFWIFPLVMWKRGNNGYTSLLPPLYINNRYSNGDYYRNILPFYAAWRDTDYGEVDETALTPLFGYSTVIDRKSKDEIYSSYWFPLLPLFYRSNDRTDGTHTNLLWLFDWASDSSGDMERFWFIPLVFHQSEAGGYRYYVPFYFRPEGTDEKEGYSYGLFHYNSWSSSRSVTWSWPYYHSENYAKASNDSAGREKNVEEYYTHFIPFYWSWQSRDSSGRIIFPLIFNYRDEHTNIHVNLTGYARKTYTGPLSPDFTIGIEKKDEGWYFDTDVSWLYDVVSFSSRIPMKNPVAMTSGSEQQDESMDQPVGSEQIVVKDVIKKKKEFSRENSEYFWGWKVLFCWMAYERADTKRHFRLLPLSWFTWDENSNDKLYMFLPFYLSYKSEEEEYFVAAPFYASQREGESYARGVLVNLYWDEYEADEDYREQTVLWPIVNWYSSPKKSGFRVFPFFWQRSWLEDNIQSSQTFSLLHYSRDSISRGNGDITYRRRISPLYHLKHEKNVSGESYSLFAPVIPLFYYNTEESVSEKQVDTSRTVLSPLYYSNERKFGNEGELFESSTFWAPVLPLFYRSTYGDYKHWNILGFLDSVESSAYNRFFILPFYYGSDYDGRVYRNILGVLDWESDADGVKKSMLFPLYSWNEENGTKLILFPLLTYIRNAGKERARFVAGAYWYSSPDYERQNFLYLLDHRKYLYPGGDKDYYSALFTTMQYNVSPEIKEMKLLWGSLLNYKNYSESSDYSIDAVLWLAALNRRGDYFHHRVLPFYSYSSEGDDGSLLLPPLLSYFSEDSAGDFDLGGLGLVYYRNNNKIKGSDRRMWLLGSLYNEVKKPERGYHEMGSLWGILWNYETEDETGFKKFTILKGLYKWKEKDGRDEHTVLWIF